jgi:hypothetical protein
MLDKLKIGYVPYSADLSHPGDRRRIGTWSKTRRNDLQLKDPTESDLLVLSAAANFDFWLNKSKQPVILDLVDGYLGEEPSILRDLGRNLVRSFKGKSNYSAVTFTRALQNACRKADAVIVASQEQAKDVLPFNSCVHIILDDHSELDAARQERKVSKLKDPSSKYIFWEGFGYTIKHFSFLAPSLDNYMSQSGYKLLILTNPNFARWGGYLGKINAEKLIKNWFPKSKNQIEIISWSIEDVIHYASLSDFAIIPVDTKDKFANLKPENKLLSMWHLGLPTLFSNTFAYQRVANEIGIPEFCIDSSNWQSVFENLEVDSLDKSLNKTENYINKTHTKDILVEKWQNVFDTVLAKNV